MEILTELEPHAREMAETINGGSWSDYTEAQKRGWLLKVAYAFEFMNERDRIANLGTTDPFTAAKAALNR